MIDLDVLVLPAFDDLSGFPSELAPWIDAYDLDGEYDRPGLPVALRYGDGVGVVPTGVGKAAAATTVSTVLTADDLALEDTTFVSVGVAGGPPTRTTIGSVILANTVVDWDAKIRLDDTASEPNPYTRAVFGLDAGLVDRASTAATAVDLDGPGETVRSLLDQYDSPPSGPAVRVGTNCCADELWHGRSVAATVEEFVDALDRSPYLATEMEDSGTAVALARHDRLDDYLSVRGVANFDRPPAGRSPAESLFGDEFEAGFSLAVENAVTVGRAIVEEMPLGGE